MTDKEYQRIKWEVQDEAFHRHAMEQPGYWLEELLVVSLSLGICSGVFAIGYAVYHIFAK